MIANLFEGIPEKLHEELFDKILAGKDFKIERIVSDGHFSPKDFWYEQEMHELVFLLQGKSKICFDDGSNYELKPGDYLNIPARKKHRVEWTDNTQKTVWLAIHYNK